MQLLVRAIVVIVVVVVGNSSNGSQQQQLEQVQLLLRTNDGLAITNTTISNITIILLYSFMNMFQNCVSDDWCLLVLKRIHQAITWCRCFKVEGKL